MARWDHLEPDDPVFVAVEGERGGHTVHVIDRESDKPVESWVGGPMGLAEGLHRLVVGWTYCGRLAEGSKHWSEVYAFEDERLCRRCIRGWPYEQYLLFVHPTL